MKRVVVGVVVLLVVGSVIPAQDQQVLDLSAPKVGDVGLIKEKLLVLGSISKDDADGVSGTLYPTKNKKQYVLLFAKGISNDGLKLGDDIKLPGRYEVTLFRKETSKTTGELIFFVGVKSRD
jgi:hypothetical protein